MRIVIYKGGAQYNALNRFCEHLGEGFVHWGHEVEFIDLTEFDKNRQPLIDALARKPNLVVGFNAMGSELRNAEKKSVYELSGSQYLGLLLDHPAFHTGRTARAPAEAIMGVVDPTHIDYLKEACPGRPAFFAPHGGIQGEHHKNSDRPIDILFCGTGLNSENERKQWKDFPVSYQSMLVEAFEEFMKEPQSLDALLLLGAQKRHLYLPRHLLAAMVVQLEIVIRADYRMEILKQLDEAGLKVTIMGNGWEHARFKHHELHPSVEHYEALKLMSQSKISLNASPQFFTGTHERVFNAMLNGAVAVTSGSRYYVEHFKDGEHYLGYDLAEFPRAIERVQQLLASAQKLKEISHEAKVIAARDHTWTARAQEYLDKFKTIAVCQYLYKKQWGM